jgi:hypothetical protein
MIGFAKVQVCWLCRGILIGSSAAGPEAMARFMSNQTGKEAFPDI